MGIMGIQVSRGGKVHSRSDRASQGVTLCGRGDNSEYRLYVVREVDCAACIKIVGGVPELDTPEYVRTHNDAWVARQERKGEWEILARQTRAAHASERVLHAVEITAPSNDHDDCPCHGWTEPEGGIVQMMCCGQRYHTQLESAGHTCSTSEAWKASEAADHAFSSHSRRSAECRICKRGADIHATFDAGTPMSEYQWRAARPMAEIIVSPGNLVTGDKLFDGDELLLTVDHLIAVTGGFEIIATDGNNKGFWRTDEYVWLWGVKSRDEYAAYSAKMDAHWAEWSKCPACFNGVAAGPLHAATCPLKVTCAECGSEDGWHWTGCSLASGRVTMPMVAEDASGTLRRTGARVADPERIMWRAPKGGKHKRFPHRHNFRMGR